jgi:hypothetical protein
VGAKVLAAREECYGFIDWATTKVPRIELMHIQADVLLGLVWDAENYERAESEFYCQ